MKSRIVVFAALLAVSCLVFAQPMMGQDPGAGGDRHGMFAGPYTASEIAAIRGDLGDRPFGELSLDKLAPYWARLETAMQKDAYVKSSAMMSMLMPGSGQFRNGNSLAGTGFLALHLGTVAGSLVGFYFLLPADLRFDRLNYFSSSLQSINDAWNAHSINDYLPSMGVMAAGAVVDVAIRFLSAKSAWDDAKAAVDSGSAKLEPMLGPGFLGMAMRF